MSLNIKNKRSAVRNSEPTPAQLQDGEIGINYNAQSPAFYIKDSAGVIRKMAGDSSVGNYWELDGSNLKPDSAAYNVVIGSDDITLGADGNVDLTGKATSDATVAGDGDATLTTKGYVDAAVAGASGATDLAIANRTATSLDVTSSTGTNATVPAATTTQAGLMTDGQFDKLADIEAGAQVNVQSDWDETDTSADSFIQNKPVIPSDVGVTKITAGTNITIDPSTGVGDVTINATGGGGGGASIEVSDDPPGEPSTGDLWWDSSETADSNGGRLYMYYTDQWVQTSNVGASSGGGGGDDFWSRRVVEGQGTLAPANPLDNMEVGGDGLCVTGRRVGIGRHPATEAGDAQLQVGGGIDAAGDVISGGDPTNGANNGCALKSASCIQATGDNSGSFLFRGWQNGDSTLKASIKADGSITATNDVSTSGTFIADRTDSAAAFYAKASGVNKVEILTTGVSTWFNDPGSGAGRGVRISNGVIQAGRSNVDDAVFQGYTVGTASPGVTITAGGSITQSKNSSTNFITCTAGTSPKFQVSGGGTVTAAGNVIAPNINTFNVQLQLEPDNFTSTTNAEGETESVYNGPTLDVKQTLLQLMSAMAAINQAANSATTLANLKAAIKTATADFQEAN